MIEEGHSTLKRCGHAHLVLLHQQLNKVCLRIRIEKAVQHVSARSLPDIQDIVVSAICLGQNLGSEELGLEIAGEAGVKIVEVEGGPVSAIAREKGMLQLPAQRCSKQMRIRDGVPNRLSYSRRCNLSIDAVISSVLQSPRVARVPRKRLVTALSSEDDLNFLLGESGDEIERDAGRPDDRFVLLPDQLWESIEELLTADANFMVLGSDVLADSASGSKLTVLFLGITDRESVNRFLTVFHCQCGYGAGIDTAAQENPKRNIRHKMTDYRFLQHRAISLDVKLFRLRAGCVDHRQIPVLIDLQLSILKLEAMTRHQFSNACVEGLVTGEVSESEIFGQSGAIQNRLYLARCEERFDFGAEQESRGGFGIVERLDAKTVARPEQPMVA